MEQRVQSNQNQYGISRIDDEKHHTHAWRVSFRRRGKRHVKNFPDQKYGGQAQALSRACEYRDTFLREHPPISRREVCTVKRSNNTSGLAGVCTYAKRYERRDGSQKENWYWEASWPDAQGVSLKAIFAVNTYGESMARQMAIRARARGLEALEGVFWSSERGLVEEWQDHYDDTSDAKVA